MSVTGRGRSSSSTREAWAEDQSDSDRGLGDEEIDRIVGSYHRWRGTLEGEYVDEAGFWKSALLGEVDAAGFALSPGRYVGAPETEEDEVEERMATLVERLSKEMADSEKLAGDVKEALVRIGYGV